MKRPLRIALVVVATFIALLILASIGLWTVQYAVSTEELEKFIEKMASRHLRRDLSIERIERPAFPSMELVMHGVAMKTRSGDVIATVKEVRAQASLSSLGRLRMGVEEMTFVQPNVIIRYEADGRTNIDRIFTEMLGPVSSKRSLSALVFNRFVIQDGTVMVFAANGDPMLRKPVRVNGDATTKIGAGGVWAPFKLQFDGGDGGLQAQVAGRFSANPTVDIVFQRFPATLLAPRFDILSRCDGDSDGRFAWNGGGRQTYDFAFSPMQVCGGAGLLPDRLSGTIDRSGRAWKYSLQATGSDSDVTAVGSDDGGRTPARWTLTSPAADAEEISGWVTQSREVLALQETPGKKPARAAVFTMTVATLTAGAFVFDHAQAEIHRSTDGSYRSDSLRAGLFGGRVKAAGTLDQKTLTLRAEAEDVDLARAAEANGSTSPVTGRLAAKIQGHAPVTDLVLGFEGDASVQLWDGHVPEVPTLLSTLTRANLVKLEDEMRGNRQEGIEITQADASATFLAGVADVKHLLLDSPVLRIGYTGKVSYRKRRLDGNIVLQPLNLADRIINDIPVLRTLLHGKNKIFLPLWFEVKGDWANPKVRALPAKSLAAPVKNIFDTVLNFPKRAFGTPTGEK